MFGEIDEVARATLATFLASSRELVKSASRYCRRVHHVESADAIASDWLDGAGVVGLTAGTSTPDHMIDGVERRLRHLAAQASGVSK